MISKPSNTPPPLITRPIPSPIRNPPNTAIRTLSLVNAGISIKYINRVRRTIARNALTANVSYTLDAFELLYKKVVVDAGTIPIVIQP